MKLFTKYFLKVAVCFYVKRKENNIVEFIHVAGTVGFGPTKSRSQSPLPYHLATPQYFYGVVKVPQPHIPLRIIVR